MNEAFLSKQIGHPKPARKAVVVAKNAWLSFDYRGIPYIDPAYASLIIPGENDGKYATMGPEEYALLEYKKYIHDRCFPGTSFEAPGELPPSVEGIAYLIRREQLEKLSRTRGFRLTTVRCQEFRDGDLDLAGQDFPARTLIAREEHRAPHLMPSLRVYGSIYRAALTCPFSPRYCRHLVLLRPYNPAHGSKFANIAKLLFGISILAPLLLWLYMPIVLLQWLLGRRLHTPVEWVKTRMGDLIQDLAILAEVWLFRPLFGDLGYAIEAT